MKILFIHSGADLYGASRSLLRLSSRLVRDGNPVMAILPYDGPLRDELQTHGVEVRIHHDLPVVTRQESKNLLGLISILLRIPFSIVKIWSVIRKFRPDIVHTNTALILSPGIAAKLRNVPHVWHVREFFVEFPKFWKWYQWFMYYFADVIVCVSTPVAKQFKERILQEMVFVIHNGFPEEEFKPVEAERIQAFRNRLGLDSNLTVGVVGRIKFARKGQDVFVKAVALLKDKFPHVQFILVGSPFPGNEEHLYNLMELIKELGIEDRVIYTGDVDDIKAAYSVLDISVLPSALPEPFGGVVIESMAFGKPVVGSELGGTLEQIEDGVTGFLVEPNAPKDLAKALEHLLSDSELRRKMGENGRKRFLALFEFGPFYEKVSLLYSKLIREAG